MNVNNVRMLIANNAEILQIVLYVQILMAKILQYFIVNSVVKNHIILI